MSGWPVGLDVMRPVDKDGGTERCKVSVITGNNSNYQTLVFWFLDTVCVLLRGCHHSNLSFLSVVASIAT